jgi:hypothetical protein
MRDFNLGFALSGSRFAPAVIADGSRNIPLHTLAAGLTVARFVKQQGWWFEKGNRTFSPKTCLMKLSWND